MFQFRKISSNLIRRQISASKPLKSSLFIPVRKQHVLALNLSLSRFQRPGGPPTPIQTSISDMMEEQAKTVKTEKEKNRESWANMDKYSEEEREQILEEKHRNTEPKILKEPTDTEFQDSYFSWDSVECFGTDFMILLKNKKK